MFRQLSCVPALLISTTADLARVLKSAIALIGERLRLRPILTWALLAVAYPSLAGVVVNGYVDHGSNNQAIEINDDSMKGQLVSNSNTFLGARWTTSVFYDYSISSGDWSIVCSTSVSFQNGFAPNLSEASISVNASTMGQYPTNVGELPPYLTFVGHLTGNVVINDTTGSFHDGSVQFGSFGINNLEDLFFTDPDIYTIDLPFSVQVPVNIATGQFPVNFAFSSDSRARRGTVAGNFLSTLVLESILLPNGNTPESIGHRLTFANGASSPNVPEAASIVYCSLVAGALASMKVARRLSKKQPSSC